MTDLLYYIPENPENAEERQGQCLLFETFAASLKLSVRELSDTDMERSMEELCHSDDQERGNGEKKEDERRFSEGKLPFLFIAVEDKTHLSDFLTLLAGARHKGLLHFPLKAAITENNSQWTLRQLLGELGKEHHWFERFEYMQSLMAQAEKNLEAKENPGLQMALEEASSFFERPDAPELSEIENMIEKLERN